MKRFFTLNIGITALLLVTACKPGQREPVVEAESDTSVTAHDASLIPKVDPSNPETLPETQVDMHDLIGSVAGHIWDNVNKAEDVYAVVKFTEETFEFTVYKMNGGIDRMTKQMQFEGKWKFLDRHHVEATAFSNNLLLEWKFSDDYSSMVNTQGIEYTRVHAASGLVKEPIRP